MSATIRRDQAVLSCSDCGMGWYLTDEEKQVCDENGWTYPSRCKSCRRKRREARLNKESESRG